MKKLLFLCTGNYYRSRFAEYLFNHRAAAAGLPWRADSRALALERGVGWNIGPLSPHAQKALTARGIPTEEALRMPQQATAADFESSDLVIAVKEAEHRPLMLDRFTPYADHIEYWHIHDLDAATPDIALAELEQKVTELLTRLTPNP